MESSEVEAASAATIAFLVVSCKLLPKTYHILCLVMLVSAKMTLNGLLDFDACADRLAIDLEFLLVFLRK